MFSAAELTGPLDPEQIQEARRLSIQRKLELSGELFDAACEVSLSGIRMQNPGISDHDALQELRRRLDLGRQLETRL